MWMESSGKVSVVPQKLSFLRQEDYLRDRGMRDLTSALYPRLLSRQSPSPSLLSPDDHLQF